MQMLLMMMMMMYLKEKDNDATAGFLLRSGRRADAVVVVHDVTFGFPMPAGPIDWNYADH
eukprot:3155454-Amphidinium_carterae.1